MMLLSLIKLNINIWHIPSLDQNCPGGKINELMSGKK